MVADAGVHIDSAQTLLLVSVESVVVVPEVAAQTATSVRHLGASAGTLSAADIQIGLRLVLEVATPKDDNMAGRMVDYIQVHHSALSVSISPFLGLLLDPQVALLIFYARFCHDFSRVLQIATCVSWSVQNQHAFRGHMYPKTRGVE